jgi:YggT family protein
VAASTTRPDPGANVGIERESPKEARVLFDSITDVQNFINVFVYVYALTLILYILASWLRLPYSLNPLQRFLHEVCDPYLRPWRRILPLSFGPMDFTPMVAIFALIFIGQAAVYVVGQFH